MRPEPTTAEEVLARAREVARQLRASPVRVARPPAPPPATLKGQQARNATRRMAPAQAEQIKLDVAKRCGVTITEMEGPSRCVPIVRARQYAMWTIRRKLDAPLQWIGKRFGGRDHSTVLHSIVLVEQIVNAGLLKKFLDGRFVPAFCIVRKKRDMVAKGYHPRASMVKLTPDEVRAIKQAKRDERCAPDVAVEYGVNKSCIYKIWKGETWSHIPWPR